MIKELINIYLLGVIWTSIIIGFYVFVLYTKAYLDKMKDIPTIRELIKEILIASLVFPYTLPKYTYEMLYN